MEDGGPVQIIHIRLEQPYQFQIQDIKTGYCQKNFLMRKGPITIVHVHLISAESKVTYGQQLKVLLKIGSKHVWQK